MSGFRADLSMLCPPFFCSSVVARVHRKSLEPGRVQFTSGAPRTPQAQQPIDAWAAGIWRIAPSFWGRSLEKLPALPFLNFFSQQRSRTPGTSLARSVTKPSLSVCGLPGFCETRMRSGLLLVSSVVGSARTFILLFLVFFLTGLRANLAPSGGKAPSISCLCALSYSIRTGATTRRAAASFSPFSASSRWGSRESTGRRDTRVFSLSSRDFHTQRRKGERSQGAAKMDSFLRPLQPKKSLFQVLQKGPLRVSLVGSGNWGSVIGKIVAQNAERSYVFHNEVRMWVFEEMVGGEKLTDIINRKHENVRYLPGYKLPENLVAVPDVVEACRDSDLLVFVMPHQFVARVCDQIAKARVVPAHARAISLLKGLHVEGGRPHLFSEMIRSRLNIVECAALSGANVANDVAREEFAEATIGHSPDETDTALIWQQLFDKPYLKVNALPDVAGVQVCGAVKNVVALAAGFCDGLGLGTNAKSAIIRLGVEEMKQFGMLFFDNVIAETFFDSAGYADVITTVFGGRNARCAAEFVRQKGKKSWDEIEAEMLNGQKLQGTLTTREVFDVISSHEVDHLFPLFAVTYEIAFKGRDPADLIRVFETKDLRAHKTPEECNMLVLPPLMSSARTRVRVAQELNILKSYASRHCFGALFVFIFCQINRLQSMVDHERFRDEEKKIVKEYERRYTQIEGVGDVTARGGSQ
ncbi:putative glycerol-3-phosphate dehydrogenase (gpdh) [Besnoitia besnoiti]|uniref:Glycerol-3-phosphate dehydrogenase [NAD(+)] n=1 Tax=Besnoitia besnoiti TaxID=94643 RepID=A0A2A9LYQ8_BESBE|nr:putative glycerol-3-phosphate dehydrogenase (gpdh) [Besnoitia besnoiti]PFH31578.1 putative glycerol-3-phosphate dehydrogenase (gpdh) [Besnoitia besnoiti]